MKQNAMRPLLQPLVCLLVAQAVHQLQALQGQRRAPVQSPGRGRVAGKVPPSLLGRA